MHKEAEPAAARFISYAQNQEDVMLRRALRHVENGFYIDVGANDPVADSVTKAFYDRGWRGINIEPLQVHCDDLRARRPRDVTLCCAAGEAAGEIEIYDCDVRGWATGEKTVAERHARQGHQGIWRRVPVGTLADICREHVTGPIHFLKIDVEGMEHRVLKGADFKRFRPWVVVVEAAVVDAAGEPRDAHEAWEGLLLAEGYHYAYGDGLNRFYAAGEHPDIPIAMSYPPNVLDGFFRAAEVDLALRARQMENKAHRAQERAASAEKDARALAQELVALYRMVPWRFIAVLRAAGRFRNSLRGMHFFAACKLAGAVMARKITRRGGAGRIRSRGFSRCWAMRLSLGALRRLVGGRPRVKDFLGKILAPFPGLTASLRHAGNPPGASARGRQAEGARDLPPRARPIYMELAEALQRRRNGLK